MRRVFSIILHVIAGFFFYGVTVMGFIKMPPAPEAKWIVGLIFIGLASVFLLAGLAIMRFRNWKRETGIVLLSASGFMAFAVFTFVCMFMSEDFWTMMPPESRGAFNAFSDYVTGSIILVALAALGFMLVRADNETISQDPRPDGEDAAVQL